MGTLGSSKNPSARPTATACSAVKYLSSVGLNQLRTTLSGWPVRSIMPCVISSVAKSSSIAALRMATAVSGRKRNCVPHSKNLRARRGRRIADRFWSACATAPLSPSSQRFKRSSSIVSRTPFLYFLPFLLHDLPGLAYSHDRRKYQLQLCNQHV